MTPPIDPSGVEIDRAELVRIVDEASADITTSTREKLLAVASTTEAVTVGWFHLDGVGCPMRQTGLHRSNQAFQEAFDRAMCTRFGLDVDEVVGSNAFIVRVTASDEERGAERG